MHRSSSLPSTGATATLPAPNVCHALLTRGPVPLENRIPALTWAFSGSGGSLVFVDQTAQDRFSADLTRAEVWCGDAGTGFSVGDALVDALVRPGGVVVLLVLGEDGAQVRLVQDQGPVEELTAQRADEALADRVHPRRLHGRAHDGGAGGLEDGIEGCGEVRAAVTDQEPEVPELLAEVQGQVRACCTVQSPVGWAVTPPRCIRRLLCSTNTSTYSLVSATVST